MDPTEIEKAMERVLENKNLYYRIAYSFTGNQADSLDAISEMTLSVLEKLGQLRDPEQFLPWSKKILMNACRKRLRDRKRTTVVAEFPQVADPYDENQWAEQWMVRKAVYGLPPKFKEIVIMRYYLDMEYQDIAHTIGLPLGTIKSRLNRAMSALKKELGGEFNE